MEADEQKHIAIGTLHSCKLSQINVNSFGKTNNKVIDSELILTRELHCFKLFCRLDCLDT